MKVIYKTKGTCSDSIEIDVDNGIINNISFRYGCSGNLQAISSLAKGMPVKDVINRLKGITCGTKESSCPDQLAKALEEKFVQIDKV